MSDLPTYRYAGGPLDGQPAPPRRGRFAAYRHPDGSTATRAEGRRLFTTPFNWGRRPFGEVYVLVGGEQAYVWSLDLAARHGKIGGAPC